MQSAALNTRFRLLPAAGLSLLFSFSLFSLLFFVIHGKGHGVNKAETLPTIDFVRLKRDTQVETMERRKPPPPPPPKQPPPPPKLKVASETPQNQQPLPFNAPNLGLSASGVGGGPFIGAMGGGGGASTPMAMFDGDIIPLSRVPAQYPRKAAQDGIEGYVKVEFIVNADGTVRSVKVVEAKPRGIFDAAAIAAAQKYKFKPKVVDGRPAEQRGFQTIEFRLSEE